MYLRNPLKEFRTVKLLQTHLGRVVDVSAPLKQEVGDVLVAVVRCYVKRCEATLGSHIRVVVILQGT